MATTRAYFEIAATTFLFFNAYADRADAVDIRFMLPIRTHISPGPSRLSKHADYETWRAGRARDEQTMRALIGNAADAGRTFRYACRNALLYKGLPGQSRH